MKEKRSRTAYILVIISCCGLAASSIGICANSLGVFFTEVSGSLGSGRGAFALHTTLTSLAQGFMSPIAARLMTKYRLNALMLIGVILAATSTALMAVSGSLWMFYLLGTVRGIGLALFSAIPINAVLGNWFHKHRGMIVGGVMAFSGLGGAIFNPVFSSFISSVGWKSSYLYMAAFIIILSIPGCMYLRLTPHEKGLKPYGEGAVGETKTVNLTSGDISMAMFILVTAFALISVTATGIGQHFSGYAESVGLGTATGAMMISAAMVGNIASKLVIGVLCDKLGAARACMAMLAVHGASMLMILLTGGVSAYLALAGAFFYGAIYSIGAVGIPMVVRMVYGENGFTRMYSLISLITSIGGAFSLTLVGAVYDVTGAYSAVFICAAIMAVVNIIILLPVSKSRR